VRVLCGTNLWGYDFVAYWELMQSLSILRDCTWFVSLSSNIWWSMRLLSSDTNILQTCCKHITDHIFWVWIKLRENLSSTFQPKCPSQAPGPAAMQQDKLQVGYSVPPNTATKFCLSTENFNKFYSFYLGGPMWPGSPLWNFWLNMRFVSLNTMI